MRDSEIAIEHAEQIAADLEQIYRDVAAFSKRHMNQRSYDIANGYQQEALQHINFAIQSIELLQRVLYREESEN